MAQWIDTRWKGPNVSISPAMIEMAGKANLGAGLLGAIEEVQKDQKLRDMQAYSASPDVQQALQSGDLAKIRQVDMSRLTPEMQQGLGTQLKLADMQANELYRKGQTERAERGLELQEDAQLDREVSALRKRHTDRLLADVYNSGSLTEANKKIAKYQKDAMFTPEATTLSKIRADFTPKTTATDTKYARELLGNASWLKTNYPEMAPEKVKEVASSEALMKQAIETQKKATTKAENEIKLADIKKAWGDKLSDKQIETAIDTYGDKAGKYLETQYKQKLGTLSTLRETLSHVQKPGMLTDSIEFTDLSKHEKELPKAYTTEEGILAQAERDPEFATNVQSILTDENYYIDTIFGPSREKRLAKYLKDYSKNR